MSEENVDSGAVPINELLSSREYQLGVIDGLSRNMTSGEEAAVQLNHIREFVVDAIDANTKMANALSCVSEAFSELGITDGLYYLPNGELGDIVAVKIPGNINLVTATVFSAMSRYWEEIADQVASEFITEEGKLVCSSSHLVAAIMAKISKHVADAHISDSIELESECE